MLNVIMLSANIVNILTFIVVMLHVYAECFYAYCFYAMCHHS